MIRTSRRLEVQRHVMQIGPYLVVFLLPLFFVPLGRWNLEITRVGLFLAIVLAMLIAWAALGVERWRSQVASADAGGSWGALQDNPLTIPALAYCLVHVLAATTSIAPGLSWWGAGNGHGVVAAVIGPVVFFLLSASALKTWRDLDRLVTVVLLGSVAVSFYGLLQSLGFDPFPWVIAESSPVGSTLGLPGLCGAYLSMVMFFALARVIGEANANSGRARAYAVVSVLQVACLVLTLDRGAILGAAAGAAVFGWLLSSRWPSGRRIGLVAVILSASAVLIVFIQRWGVLLLPAFETTVAELGEIRETSNAVRLILWRDVLGLISARPLLGYGPATFRLVYDQVFASKYAAMGELVPTDPFNIFLYELMSAGVAGLLAFGWVLLAFFRTTLQQHHRIAETYRRAVVAACVSSATSYLVQAQFHPPAIVLLSLLWFVFALGVVAAGTANTSSQDVGLPD